MPSPAAGSLFLFYSARAGICRNAAGFSVSSAPQRGSGVSYCDLRYNGSLTSDLIIWEMKYHVIGLERMDVADFLRHAADHF